METQDPETMSNFNSIRLIPQNKAILDRKTGSDGDVFFDQAAKTLRLFTSTAVGGIPLLRADLANLTGVITIAYGETPPTQFSNGSLWYNTADATMYVSYSGQWVQPT
jgi:hypothetical protein